MALLQLLARALERRQHLAAAAGGHGNRVHHPKQPAHAFDLVVRLVDHEADESLDARSHEEAVDMRDVIADEQRRPARRHVLLTFDANPVDGVREEPQAESDGELGHDAQHIEARHEREHAEREKDGVSAHRQQ